MKPGNSLEVKINGVSAGYVEYVIVPQRQPSGKGMTATAADFAVWLKQMQDSGLRMFLEEKADTGILYASAQTIDGVLVSSGTARFLQKADRLDIAYTLGLARQGPNAATMAYARPEKQEGGDTRDVLYFLLFSQPDGENIPRDILRTITGVNKPDRAKNNAQLLLRNEMEPPAFAPFLSPQFRTLTRIIFDESSLAKPEPHDFSTGISPERGGGYVRMSMSDAYKALAQLHGENLSRATLVI